MNIIILNGSPRPSGNTAAMVNAFMAGAKESGHNITPLSVRQRKTLKQLSAWGNL